ncbi:hypothetical protein BHM03_00035849 [Ensete ventricosum]|nr:hypothetical protein BHM03_00035849 [Ensete ventricosum]
MEVIRRLEVLTAHTKPWATYCYSRSLPRPHPLSVGIGRDDAGYHPVYSIVGPPVSRNWRPKHSDSTCSRLRKIHFNPDLPMPRDSASLPRIGWEPQKPYDWTRSRRSSSNQRRSSRKAPRATRSSHQIFRTNQFGPVFGSRHYKPMTVAQTPQSILWPSKLKWPSTTPQTH